MNIILYGIKHSGKSTAGLVTAKKAGMFFCDTDTEIEEFEKKTVREIYRLEGESSFKKAEAEACRRIAERIYPNGAVIATGGGICSNSEALDLLKNFGLSIFLDTAEETLMQRIFASSAATGSLPAYIERENPRNEQEIRAVFHTFYTARRSLYLEKIPFVICADGLNPEKLAEKIFIEFKNRC